MSHINLIPILNIIIKKIFFLKYYLYYLFIISIYTNYISENDSIIIFNAYKKERVLSNSI